MILHRNISVLLGHEDRKQKSKNQSGLQGAGLREVKVQRSGVSRVFSHNSKANLVPVLTRSTSGPPMGARLSSTVSGSVESISVPSVVTCDTLKRSKVTAASAESVLQDRLLVQCAPHHPKHDSTSNTNQKDSQPLRTRTVRPGSK